jgi:HEAT repeat protein
MTTPPAGHSVTPLGPRLEGHTWVDPAGLGATYTFHRDGEKLRVRVVLFGSGVHIRMDSQGLAEISGDRLRIHPPSADSTFEEWIFDNAAGVFRVVNDCSRRLAPGTAPESPAHEAWPALRAQHVATESQLVEALNHPDRVLRREAILALAEWRVTQTASPQCAEILRFVEDADAEIRACASYAAGQCKERRAVPALLRNLSHSDAWVRKESARALGWGRLGGEAAVKPLTQLARDPDSGVRAAAQRALEMLKP